MVSSLQNDAAVTPMAEETCSKDCEIQSVLEKWRKRFTNISNIFWMGKLTAERLQEAYPSVMFVDATVMYDMNIKDLQTRTPDELLDTTSKVRRQLQNYGSLVEEAQIHLKDKGYAIVHCNAGMNRSSAVVAGLLILHCNKQSNEAWASIRAQKPFADCKGHFAEIVKVYEKWCTETNKQQNFADYALSSMQL